MLLFDPEPDLPSESGLLRQIQRHGKGCLLDRSDTELGSHGLGRGRPPCPGLGRVRRREGEDWKKAGKNRRSWGPDGPPHPPSRPPARDPVREDGDYGFHGGEVGDDLGHAECDHLVPLVDGVGSENADGGCLDGCGCFICMDFVQPQTSCNLGSSTVVQALFLHMQMGVIHSTLCFFTRSDALPTRLCCGLPKVHGCDDLLEANLMPRSLHLHQNCEEVSNPILISCSGYGNLILHHIYIEILDSVCWPIDHAARSLEKFSWNQLSSVNLWSKGSIIVTILRYTNVHTQELPIEDSPVDQHEQVSPTCSCCTRSYSMDGNIVEDTVPLLFGLCHRRWTATPPSLILIFNREDRWRLSSVKDIRYLQLNAHKPQVYTSERPLGESPAGHPLVWSTKEAIGDCSCSKFEPGLSRTDGRCLTPIVVFGIFYVKLGYLEFVLCSLALLAHALP